MGYYDEDDDYDEWDDMTDEEKEEYRRQEREDEEERMLDELYERCYACHCGAWQVVNGKPCHVADCICGAE